MSEWVAFICQKCGASLTSTIWDDGQCRECGAAYTFDNARFRNKDPYVYKKPQSTDIVFDDSDIDFLSMNKRSATIYYQSTFDNWKTCTLAEIKRALRWMIAIDPVEKPYSYQGDWRVHMEYCSDRMNGGRALAILNLIEKEEKEK